MYGFIDSWPPEFFDFVGVMGFGLYVINYSLLTCHKLNSTQIRYFALNWLAASLVLVGLLSSFNLAAAMIQVFWICISSVAIAIRLRNRSRPTDPGFSSARAG